MKKILPISLIGMLLIMMLLPLGSAFAYTGGLLDGKALNYGTNQSDAFGTSIASTDSNADTYISLGYYGSRDTIWYPFSTPQNIRSYQLNYSTTAVQKSIDLVFYDSTGAVIQTINRANLVNTNVRTNINVDNVSKIALINYDTSNTALQYVREFDLFTTSETVVKNDVTNLTATNISDTTATLSWTDSTDTDFVSAEIYDGTNLISTVTKGTQTYNLTGLSAETSYTYTVKAKYSDGSVSIGKNVTFTTTAVPQEMDLVAPSNISNLVANATDKTINFTWTNPIDDDFRTVYIYQDNSLIGTSSSGSYSVDGLSPDTEYVYKFVAEDTSGNIATGVTQTVKTLTDADIIAPNPPSGLYVDSGSQALYISWDENLNDTAGYNIYVDGVKKNSTLIRNTFFTVSNLVNDQSYSVTVSAVDYSGNESAQSAAVSGTPLASGLPLIETDYSLADVALGIESWFSSYWSILAFAIAIPLSFYIAARIKLLFLD